MKSNYKEWIKRYLPAEIIGAGVSILIAWIFFSLTKSRLIAALASTWAENISYYTFIAARDIHHHLRQYESLNEKYTFRHLIKKVVQLFMEFGTGEVIDSFLIRPFCLYIFPLIVGNFPLGIFIGKVTADFFFYIPTILSYEYMKKIKS